MLRESQVQSEQFNEGTRGWYKIRVFYTDELIETSPFDLLFFAGAILPYLFVGRFTDIDGNSSWFFSNSARHIDMRKAVEETFGKPESYEYGQLWVDMKRLTMGDNMLSFELLTLHNNFPEREAAIASLKSVIKPEYLGKNFTVMTT